MPRQDALTKLAKLLTDYRSTSTNTNQLVEYHNADSLRGLLNLDSDNHGDQDALFSWIEKYLQYSVRTNHSGFVNRMWAEANLPSVLGEMVTAIAQTSACTYESAPVAVLIEQFMFDTILELVGFKNGEAQMTTGSSNANMIAMLCARNMTSEKIKGDGLIQAKPLSAFVSADAHYSLDKAANVLGLGTNNLLKVPINANGEMDPEQLELAIQSAQEKGSNPFFVCATAGTTVRGAYDPIEALLRLRDKYDFWLHVDAAWGGGVLLDKELRKAFLPGIEKVDSLSWDFHKMLGTSLMCNVFLVNSSQQHLNRACGAGDGSYLFREQEEEQNNNQALEPGISSLQCGRRVDAFKWFLDWKFYGQRGLAERVQNFLALSEFAENIILDNDKLELMAPRQSFNLCFRFLGKDSDDLNELNQKLRTTLYQRGISLVGIAWIGNDLVLRWLSSNPALDQNNISDFFNTLIETGEEISSKNAVTPPC